jgi:hypothetical protein
MFPIIRSRLDGHKLSRQLRQSLADDDAKWKIGVDDEGSSELSNAEFRVVLVPRAVRLLDAVHVYNHDAEVWLPLVARLRLRAAARSRLLQNANENVKDLVKKKRPRAATKRSRAATHERRRARAGA